MQQILAFQMPLVTLIQFNLYVLKEENKKETMFCWILKFNKLQVETNQRTNNFANTSLLIIGDF